MTTMDDQTEEQPLPLGRQATGQAGNTSPEPVSAEPGEPEAMNRSRHARKDILRKNLTRGEVELDDIHAVLTKQWVLLAILSFMVGTNSIVVFMLLALWRQ